MKKISKYIAGLFGLMIVFSGCQLSELQLEEKLEPVTGDKVKVYFNCITPEEATGARKAYASINFNSYSYDLFAKESGAGGYTKLNDEKVDYKAIYSGTEIAPKTYSFQLKAYDSNNQTVMTGTTEAIDLAKGYQHIDFVMRPEAGLKGSAKITVDFPDDSSVAKIETCLTTVDNPFASTQVKAQNFTTFEVSPDYNGYKRIVLNYEELSSGEDVCAYIKILDGAGKVISSRLEAIEITGGVVSESKIHIEKLRTYAVTLPLMEKGQKGAFPGKEIVLRDKDGTEYVLADDGTGTFTGSVADGEYDIFMRDKGDSSSSMDTGLNYVVGSDSNQKEINFITVTLPGDAGLHYTPVEGGGIPVPVDSEGNHEKNDDGNYEYLVPAGGKLIVNVGYENGFNGPSGEITIGDQNVKPAASGTTPVNPTNTLEIPVPANGTTPNTSVSGVKAIEYNIIFAGDKYNFVSGYSKPTTYTAADGKELPKYSDVEYTGEGGYILDGWKDASGNVYADIPKGTTGIITLSPVWKQGVVVEPPAAGEEKPEVPGEFTVAPSLFACGYSLIIKWSDEVNGKGETNIYIDYNGDGKVNGDDKMVSGSYNKSPTDFTGYKLEAKNADGSQPASNFTYTVLGGKLASLTGLGYEKQNTSTVNISGKNTVIGNGKNVGVDLETLTNEWVNINDQMSGEYHITLVSRHEFNKNEKTHKVAYIENPNYAQTSRFTCIKKGTNNELGLGFANVKENERDKIIIYLKDPSPIHLPSKEDIMDGGLNVFVWNDYDGTVPMEFMLGSTAIINEKCSVFSISVKNGTFRLKETDMKKDDGSILTTAKLGQRGATTYDVDEKVVANVDYIYLHMFSKDNMITPARATEFLRSIYFIRDSADKDIEITLNLEAVPYEQIEAMQNKYGANKFSYFDGSFYLGIELPNKGTITWHKAYNEAKQQVFNGLNGYLINITSEVENNYIYKRMNLGQSWTGGARYDARTEFDTSTIAAPTAVTLDTAFKWQAGPEAGKTYTNGTISTKNISSVYSRGKYATEKSGKNTYYYINNITQDLSALVNKNVNFYNYEMNVIGTGKAVAYDLVKQQLRLSAAPSMESKGLFQGNYSTSDIILVAAADSTLGTSAVQISGAGKYKASSWAEYTNWDGGEPNDSNKGKSEQCMHFLTTGLWNDYSTDYGSVYGYIVEFTPYENKWHTEKANYPSMKAQINY